jgi:hypothetical protein
VPLRTFGLLASKRTSPAELNVSSVFPGQNKNETVLVADVRKPSPENNRSPERALNGVSASDRSS